MSFPTEIPVIINERDAIFLAAYFAGYSLYEEKFVGVAFTKEDKLNGDKNFRRIYKAMPEEAKKEFMKEMEKCKDSDAYRKEQIDNFIEMLKDSRDEL